MKLTVSQLCIDEGDSDDEEGVKLWFEMRAAHVLGQMLKNFVNVCL